MHRSLQVLFERHVAGSYDKQLYLAEVTGHASWTFDPSAGTIAFRGHPAWRVQVIGSAAEDTGEWQWAWADQPQTLAPRLLKVSQGMRRLGALRDIPELITPQLRKGESVGLRMAMIACGIFRGHGFYRAPYPGGDGYAGGAGFVVLADPSFPRNEVTPAVRIPTVVPQVLRRFPDVNHRRMLLGYLKTYRLTHRRQGDDVIAFDAYGPVLRARFRPWDTLVGMDPI